MSDKKPLIICLTPVKNEANNIERFLKCASLWADYIIISDQNSVDNSVQIASKFGRVNIIKNEVNSYDEWEMRKPLFDEARKINGDKILLTVDADEILTPNFLTSDEWNKILNAVPGTVIKSRFINLLPDLKHYWDGPFDLPWGFVDDCSEYLADKIHTNRNIYPSDAPVLLLNEIKVIHYQFTDWERMESKHKWYQCWERINNPEKSAINIYREYHHMYSLRNNQIKEVPTEWFEAYIKLGIDIFNIKKEKNHYWDKIVLDYFVKYGAAFFKKEAVWDIDWVKMAKSYGYDGSERFADPRSKFQKMIHRWLKNTQKNFDKIDVRIVSKILKMLFRL